MTSLPVFRLLLALLLTLIVAFSVIPAPMALSNTLQPIVLNQSPADGIPYVDGAHNASWPSIVSQAAVVVDMNTGTVVYAKNPNVQHYPASITKIMTALLALKYGHLDDTLTASKNAVGQPPDKLYMVAGEKEQLEPLLYGLLLDSANDVAVEIAEHYGGSVSHFAEMMNQEAVSLGATHTHFVNPNGLPNPKHVTTAYDMALIARAAMQYPEFRKIVATKYYDWHGQVWHSHLSNLNRMLFNYPGTIGIKTGFTNLAHETLAVAATHGHDTFLAILMDTPTDAEIRRDATQLLNYAFAHYQTQPIISKGQMVGTLPGGHVGLTASHAVLATVAKGSPFAVDRQLTYALPPNAIRVGQDVGTLELLNSTGDKLAKIPVVSGANWTASESRDSVLRVNVLVPLIILLSIALKLLRVLVARQIRRKYAIQRDLVVGNPRFRGDGMSHFRQWHD